MKIDEAAPVLVTGGSGYVASWVVRYLLEDGRTVRATMRDPRGRRASSTCTRWRRLTRDD